MNYDNEEELQQQQKEAEAGKKAAHVAGKTAAAYFGGGAGVKAYDLASKTGVGQQLEQSVGNQLNRNPLINKASQKLNDSGALDVADKALDKVGGGDATGASAGGGGLPNTNGLPSSGGLPNTNNSSGSSLPPLGGDKGQSENSNIDSSSSNNNSDDNNKSNFSLDDPTFDLMTGGKKKKILILIPVISFLFMILVSLIIAASSLMPLMNAYNYVKGLWDKVVDLFTEDQEEKEEKFYKELENTQNSIKGVCIDVNLITATLTVYTTFDEFIEEGQESSGVLEEGQEVPYDKMTRQIKLLANMQIMNSHYQLDDSGSYCSNVEETIPIATGDKNSSTPELIAGNDFNMFFVDWFTSKTTEEQNNAYYIYRPKFASDGTCSETYAKNKLPQNGKVLSIGDYETRKESVYYWNLVNSFIPSYYSEYLPNEASERTEKIHKIADEIYLLYEQIGPSQTCNIAYAGPSSLCPNGVTIEDQGTFELEEYVAGVVSREAYTTEEEALKAQAVAARTFVLNYTNYCTKTIPNSTNAQTFTRDINDNARQATMETAGEVLINEDGKVFAAMYDSFCYDDNDCPDSTKNADGSYTVTYTKVPNGEKHTITLSDSSEYRKITHGQGHAHGMSQLYSYQLAKEGYNYQEILKFFYSEGIEISLVTSPISTEGAKIISTNIGSYLENSNSSIEEMNNYIFSSVAKAGIGTREGVVAAANSLISGIYTRTGYILPYELRPDGKYDGYGIDPAWGTNTNNAKYPVNGLDCSGFISWAIHNGGYNYVVKSAKSWGNAGKSRAWSKGTKDGSALPGDLIYNAPKSANGTTGHIRMIIGVTEDEYIVAEASSGKNGVRIKNISFTSTGNYYLVDMSSYYDSATKVSDYPS